MPVCFKIGATVLAVTFERLVRPVAELPPSFRRLLDRGGEGIFKRCSPGPQLVITITVVSNRQDVPLLALALLHLMFCGDISSRSVASRKFRAAGKGPKGPVRKTTIAGGGRKDLRA